MPKKAVARKNNRSTTKPRAIKKNRSKKISRTIKSVKHKVRKKGSRSSERHAILKRVPELLILLGLIMMISFGLHWYWRNQSLTLSQSLVEELAQQVEVQPAALPTKVRFANSEIRSLSLGGYENGDWILPATQAAYLVQSARPGQQGNIVLYGHNTHSVFGLLKRVDLEEEIELVSDDGYSYFYKISEIIEVDPSQVEFIQPTDYEVLTIYTCTGFMDRKRLIIRAMPTIKL